MNGTRPVRSQRCVLAKVGLDGHQRGVQIVARAWRDAGFEVVYLGLRNTPATVARVAVDEGADVVGLSILSGSHLHLVSEVRRELDALGSHDLPIIVGGVIPDQDVSDLRARGAAVVLGPGSTLADVVEAVRTAVQQPSSRPTVEIR